MCESVFDAVIRMVWFIVPIYRRLIVKNLKVLIDERWLDYDKEVLHIWQKYN